MNDKYSNKKLTNKQIQDILKKFIYEPHKECEKKCKKEIEDIYNKYVKDICDIDKLAKTVPNILKFVYKVPYDHLYVEGKRYYIAFTEPAYKIHNTYNIPKNSTLGARILKYYDDEIKYDTEYDKLQTQLRGITVKQLAEIWQEAADYIMKQEQNGILAIPMSTVKDTLNKLQDVIKGE